MNLKPKRCEYWMAAQKQMKRVVPLLLVIMPACSIAECALTLLLSGDTEAVADLSRFEKGMTYLVAMKSKFGSMIPLYSLVL